MLKTNSPKRSYNSSRRQESAQMTRQDIAKAALQLFSLRGYRGASMDAIAEAAVVAPETIYATFGSKGEILHYLINISVGGDEATSLSLSVSSWILSLSIYNCQPG